eukprot:1136661-Pelagomonas_calceolata.AAC.3
MDRVLTSNAPCAAYFLHAHASCIHNWCGHHSGAHKQNQSPYHCHCQCNCLTITYGLSNKCAVHPHMHASQLAHPLSWKQLNLWTLAKHTAAGSFFLFQTCAACPYVHAPCELAP